MKLFESPLFWVAGLIAIGVGVAVKLTRRSEDDKHERTKFGFKDVVKDPEAWQEAIDDDERDFQAMLAQAKNWSDEMLAKEVWRFVFEVSNSREASVEGRVLQRLPSRVNPILNRYLGDKTLRERLVTPTEKEVLPQTPFDRVCLLLDDDRSPERLALYESFLTEQSPQIRNRAIGIIASAGTESTVGPIRKAFTDPDEYVRSSAIFGVQEAIKEKRLSAVCRKELFDDVKTLLLDGKSGDYAVSLLLQLDTRNATEFLLSEKLLNTDSRCLHYVLSALNERAILVPRSRLLGLLEKLRSPELEYPHTYQLGEVLQALGMHKMIEDRASLEGYLSHKEKVVAQGAATGLLASHGLGDFRARIWDTIETRGIRALKPAQRHYHAVQLLDGEVRNGGFSQYFFNSSGDEWRAALQGLEAMGDEQRVAVLREVLAKFGERGPSMNREERMSQLAKLARPEDKLFDDLDSRYYASTEVLEVLVMRYVLKHPEAFR